MTNNIDNTRVQPPRECLCIPPGLGGLNPNPCCPSNYVIPDPRQLLEYAPSMGGTDIQLPQLGPAQARLETVRGDQAQQAEGHWQFPVGGAAAGSRMARGSHSPGATVTALHSSFRTRMQAIPLSPRAGRIVRKQRGLWNACLLTKTALWNLTRIPQQPLQYRPQDSLGLSRAQGIWCDQQVTRAKTHMHRGHKNNSLHRPWAQTCSQTRKHFTFSFLSTQVTLVTQG